MKTLLLGLLLFFVMAAYGQEREIDPGFKDYYPISKRPTVSGGIGNNEFEQILIEASPTVYYGLHNDIRESLTADSIVRGDAIYISLQPQLRLYNENSKPVKTPSYKAFIGWQPIFRTSANNFITLGIETGHYSNGQSGTAFSTQFEEGTEEGNAIYDTITDETDLSSILNRRNGNFSTNLTRILANYRINYFTDDNLPERIHSFTLGYQLYHNKLLGLFDFGGYNPNDIDLYGRHQIELGYEYTSYVKKSRYTISQELIIRPDMHPSTEPIRSVTQGILYPWNNDLGLFAAFSFGFDDYNYRFVDSFPRLSIGLTWDWFAPFVRKR